MGNSEVGHLNLGAGRVVMQDLVRIGESIRDRSFFENARSSTRATPRSGTAAPSTWWASSATAACTRSTSISFALIDLCAERSVPRIAIHALLDGRDTMPRSALGYMRQLLDYAGGRAVVASLGGRYFGMDRDKRWDRIEKWYRVGRPRRRPERHRSARGDSRGVRAERDRRVHHADGDRPGRQARSRRCATATRSSASTTARTACGRSCGR